ncbi:MAG: hypothetical protein HONDAALG_01708 [Gammaproteobacteria bacterium]|nr:hypothetical protein [Gammaproteobacteria bacterium]
MRSIFFTSSLILASAGFLVSQMPLIVSLAFQTAKPLGIVKGTVTDSNGNVILGSQISIRNESGESIVNLTTDSRGRFEVQLPANVKYYITASNTSFAPFQRSPFLVNANTSTVINIIPVFNSNYNTPMHKYESFPLPLISGEMMYVLFRFNEREQKDETLAYTSKEQASMMSFNHLAIYANKILFDPRLYRITAENDVLIDDGKRSFVARKVEAVLSSSGISLTAAEDYIKEVTGEGSIQEGQCIFSFQVNRDLSGHLTYEDKRKGISLTRSHISHFRVLDDSNGTVRFSGGAYINNKIPVSFFVTVQATNDVRKLNGIFSIDVYADGLKCSGVLSTGKVNIRRNM